MKNCDKRKNIDNDKWLKDFQREALKKHMCSNCTNMDCKHNNYFIFLRATARQNSISTTAVEFALKMIEMGGNKGSV